MVLVLEGKREGLTTDLCLVSYQLALIFLAWELLSAPPSRHAGSKALHPEFAV